MLAKFLTINCLPALWIIPQEIHRPKTSVTLGHTSFIPFYLPGSNFLVTQNDVLAKAMTKNQQTTVAAL